MDGRRQDPNRGKKGFAGLSDMVSDVEEAIRQSAQHEPSQTETSSSAEDRWLHTPSGASEPVAPNQPTDPARTGGGLKYGWVLFGAVILILVVLGIVSDPPPPSYTGPRATTGVNPAQQPGNRSAGSVAGPPEERPPPGRDRILNVAQIRYCLAESIRNDGAYPVVDESSEREVDAFNGSVDDYNSRCSEYRYYDASMGQARRDIEPLRASLLAQGRTDFLRQMGRAPSASSEQERIVRSIQSRLNDLGYSAGRADGVAGPATQSAIRQFQRDRGLAQTGEPSLYILYLLEERTSSADGIVSDAALSAVFRELQGTESSNRHDTSTAHAASPTTSGAQAARTSSRGDRSGSDSPGKPDMSHVSQVERQGIERACNYARTMQGPAAYYGCISRELAALRPYDGKPDISRASSEERSAIERACNYARTMQGPAAYYSCISRELAALRPYDGKPDMSRASPEERSAIERACNYARTMQGAAAYYSCISRELAALRPYDGKPDMSRASSEERLAIERACNYARTMQGPAAYYSCISRELAALRPYDGKPDMSKASPEERSAIERACNYARTMQGPAAYYGCILRELRALGQRG